MADIARCMGSMKYEPQCQKCVRLPQTVEDENAKKWVGPDDRATCGKFMEAQNDGL
jgi:hypothetical protein